jgi:hypothetical protein
MTGKREEESFATYKGMGVVPMIRGIPLFALLGGAAIAIVTGVFGCMKFGPIGLIGPFLVGVTLFALKIICENDNKAIERLKWRYKAWKLRASKVSLILNVNAAAPGAKHEHFFRYLKKVYRSNRNIP